MNYERALQSVDELLRSIVNSDVDVLREASHHILEAGGKRVRPRLTLLAYEAVGGKNLDEAIPVAAAIELVHTATLVHDDINDHGSMRRGRPTVNARWGRTFALLTGDYLFTKVYELMAPYKDMNVIFAQATVALVEGETLQAAAARSGQLDRETYTRIIAKKTASLFAAACKLGAMLGGGTKEQIDALEQYGFNLGLAFQIVDDILDLVADSQKLGKTAGIDVAQGKGLVTALATSNGSNGKTVATAVLEAEPAADPMAAFKQKMLSGGYIEEGRRNAEQLSALAAMSLATLPPSPAVTEMQALTRQVIERDH
jgi:geranylgeranyl pyrophosphate synthase